MLELITDKNTEEGRKYLLAQESSVICIIIQLLNMDVSLESKKKIKDELYKIYSINSMEEKAGFINNVKL